MQCQCEQFGPQSISDEMLALFGGNLRARVTALQRYYTQHGECVRLKVTRGDMDIPVTRTLTCVCDLVGEHVPTEQCKAKLEIHHSWLTRARLACENAREMLTLSELILDFIERVAEGEFVGQVFEEMLLVSEIESIFAHQRDDIGTVLSELTERGVVSAEVFCGFNIVYLSCRT